MDERLVPKEKIGEEKKDDDEESQQSDLMQDQSESMDLRLVTMNFNKILKTALISEILPESYFGEIDEICGPLPEQS